MPERVMVVEDEPLIAMELADVISRSGYTIVGPAANVSRALQLLADPGCDAAVLDVNLGGELVTPITEAMHRLSLPFVIVSGYAQNQQPPAFSGAPFLPKPVDTKALQDVLKKLLQ
jgi:DNA-binding NarL/FixJ family response regulator